MTIASEAIKATLRGDKFFESTFPHNCGEVLRYASTGACVKCTRERSKKNMANQSKERKQAWHKANREYVNMAQRARYHAKKDKENT